MGGLFLTLFSLVRLTFVFQATIVYGMWPSIMRLVVDKIGSLETEYSMRFEQPGGRYNLWLLFVDGYRTWHLLLHSFVARAGWERKAVEYLAYLHSCCPVITCPIGILSVVAPSLLDILSSDSRGHESIRIPAFDLEWIVAKARQSFLGFFHGNEPFSILDFFMIRFKGALTLD